MSDTISIRKGLNIRLVGEAKNEVNVIPVSGIFGVSPNDFHGLIPKLAVKEVKQYWLVMSCFLIKRKNQSNS